jgi:hypothetical protein
MKHIFNALIIILLITFGCNNNQTENISNSKDSAEIASKIPVNFEIWQLDYYPDSIFITHSINFNHIWESNYAYNIQFSEDSCQFIGWHESWWNRLKKVNKNEYRTISDPPYCYELKFNADGKLFMREIWEGSDTTKISKYYPYHRVEKILTQDSLQRRIAKEIFAGTYELIYNDTFACDKKIILDEKFGVKGIKGIVKYGIETEIDWDFSVENAFWLTPKNNKSQDCFSFKFVGDTLFIKDYKTSESPDGDYAEITKTRIKMLKIK